MSALDAGLFLLENENTPMHVGSVLVFEGPAPGYQELIRLMLARLPLVPRYRQRVRAVPLGLGRPAWVDDEHFQLRYHVRHAAVPAPGDAERLRDLAGRVFAQRLDATRPLWEIWLVDGVRDERWALIAKTHHCLVDGVAGVDLVSVLLDDRPDPRPPPPRSWVPRPAPGPVGQLIDGVRDAVTGPAHRLARVPALVRGLPGHDLRDLGRQARDAGPGLPVGLRRLAAGSARSLNGPIGPHRRWEWTQARLSRLRAIRAARGGTINDALLAAVTRGFRDLLAGRGELTHGQVVRSLVPVALRPGDRIRPVLVNLPVGERDPRLRLARLRGQLDEVTRGRRMLGARALAELPGFAAPTLVAVGSRVAPRFPQSVVQTVIVSVPGPRAPRYLLGRPLVEIRPYLPIAGNVRIAVGAVSYLERLSFGLTADFDAVPDLAVLRDGIRAGLDELTGLAEG